MTIELKAPELEPALIYNRIFMNNLEIEQAHQSDDLKSPTYRLSIGYQIYAVDPDGMRHFKPKINYITIENYLEKAQEKALEGDFDLVAAMQAIEAALAKIIDDQTDLGGVEVTS